MASAMPDPNVNLQLQGSHCGFVVDERLLVKNIYILDLFAFFQRA